MRPGKIHFFLFALLLATSFNSCKKDCVYGYDAVFYEPVYSTWEEIRGNIGSEDPQPIHQPGKIFALGNLLFINEVNEGIHVIDNSDPENPQNIKFIRIPGSLDIAASGNRLYSDNYSDLITLDISDIDNVQEIARISDVFFDNSFGFWYDYSAEGVITAWEMVDTFYEYDCNQDIWLIDGPVFDGGVFETAGGPVVMADAAAPDVSGKAGSMARFALHNTTLYALNNYEMHVFNIAGSLTLAGNMELPWGIETIFPYGDHLFIGSQNGMHILSILDPYNPVLLSTYDHITSCDPVVVEGDLAYVTLRSGNACQGFTDQLEIIDISDLRNPELLITYDMFNPHGLGLAGSDLLFLCDGDAGLKIFNSADPMDLQLIKQYESIHAYDVIPYGTKLLMIGDGGFYQYDYSDMDNIHLISTIPVE
jgi:hypothetical protein